MVEGKSTLSWDLFSLWIGAEGQDKFLIKFPWVKGKYSAQRATWNIYWNTAEEKEVNLSKLATIKADDKCSVGESGAKKTIADKK